MEHEPLPGMNIIHVAQTVIFQSSASLSYNHQLMLATAHFTGA